MDKRIQVLDLPRQEDLNIDTAKNLANQIRRNLIDGIKLAKNKWYYHLVSRIYKISRNLNDTW